MLVGLVFEILMQDVEGWTTVVVKSSENKTKPAAKSRAYNF
jgi:hypothetical protein